MPIRLLKQIQTRLGKVGLLFEVTGGSTINKFMNELLQEKYACGTCGRIYGDNYAAKDCCPNRAEERWVCAVCGETFWDEGEGKVHILQPHGASTIDSDTQYIEMLQEGLPPVPAWQKSHRVVSDDRRIIEEVLQL